MPQHNGRNNHNGPVSIPKESSINSNKHDPKDTSDEDRTSRPRPSSYFERPRPAPQVYKDQGKLVVAEKRTAPESPIESSTRSKKLRDKDSDLSNIAHQGIFTSTPDINAVPLATYLYYIAVPEHLKPSKISESTFTIRVNDVSKDSCCFVIPLSVKASSDGIRLTVAIMQNPKTRRSVRCEYAAHPGVAIEIPYPNYLSKVPGKALELAARMFEVYTQNIQPLQSAIPVAEPPAVNTQRSKAWPPKPTVEDVQDDGYNGTADKAVTENILTEILAEENKEHESGEMDDDADGMERGSCAPQ